MTRAVQVEFGGELLRQIERWLDQTSLTQVMKTSADLEVKGHAGAESPLPWAKFGIAFKSLWKSGSTRTREVRRDLEPRTEQLIEDLNAFLRDFSDKLVNQGKQGLVVIIDDLERIPIQASAPGVASPVDLFVHHADNLKAPACHVVYTVPISLFYDHNLGDIYPQIHPVILPMVRVRDRQRKPDPDGIEAMRQLLLKRADLDQVADPEAIDELITRSGGHVRDLMRLVRAACLAVTDTRRGRITAPLVRRAVTDFANEFYAKMAYEALPELAQVYRVQRLRKEHGRLAQQLLVMEYRDPTGESWNDLHPCVLELAEVKRKLRPSGARGGP